MRRKRQQKRGSRFHILSFIFIASSTIIFLLLYFAVSSKSWNGKSRFTVVIESDKSNPGNNGELAILSVEPQANRGIYLSIKDNIMMDIPYGYKTYPAFSVYKLGTLDNKRGGGKLLKSSIETTFGIKTDRYIYLKSKAIKNLPLTAEEYSKFRKNYFNFYTGMRFLTVVLSNAETDMNIIEKIRFYQAIKNLKMSGLNFTDLVQSQAATLETLPDNSKVYNIDSEIFDHQFGDDFQNLDVRRSEYTLEVQNATGKEKIAGQFSRILNTLGAYVILKTTSDKDLDKRCQIFIKKADAKDSIIAKILEEDYHCSISPEVNESQLRSDILVKIGKDFLK